MSAPPLTRGLLGTGDPSLVAHLATHGPLPHGGHPTSFAGELTGRGGAGFPTARKLASVADAARAARVPAVVVGNGGEGEPAAAKDATLLARSPHLVLDGLQLAARAVGADTVVLAAGRHQLAGLDRALGERGDRERVRLVGLPDRFLAGEETALVAAVDGGPSLPRGKVPPVWQRGVQGRPTLVQNVETLARLALLARGDGAAGHTLVTRHVAGRADVAEVPLGARLAAVLPLDAGTQAVLVGGYHGSWLPAAVAAELTLERSSLASVGASLGAGVLAALPADRCGVRETAAVVGYLAAQSAGQCGPCLNGLPRIATALELLARPGPRRPQLLADLERWSGLVVGRGACTHPDGSVRLVASALRVFAPELDAHAAGWCTAAPGARPFLPVPGGAR
ncbi:NADH-ubiquinone oxidoreductase-F iron-sulfur binding region domain-containing protein [Klenkia sp. PcliD-1-E]|uniref:NADH-ubiquinone oxidoreductase-F iron-sulfur binding region domain-containing protein n=1 Tax=Klenkia sp. PcliD-1-E TaxID=2954492 RepID=UPI00209693D7|nr:NADH-ubiquinone oxidoreductase-F iron-sulfur binding region domain-containing protein [Klenkia sp. PcliD-1-E]MCO7220953.1 proton-conducting membrane transporter [Klenkia sp. PcliD-1-E]